MTAKLSNAQIAWRAAQDLPDGAYVNLGIGFPEMIAKFKPDGREVIYHTENGILDFGEAPPAGAEDWDLINAGKKAVTLNPGAAKVTFDPAKTAQPALKDAVENAGFDVVG